MADAFHARFDIDLSLDEARRRFVNRVETRCFPTTELVR